jgi:hypothetical protein
MKQSIVLLCLAVLLAACEMDLHQPVEQAAPVPTEQAGGKIPVSISICAQNSRTVLPLVSLEGITRYELLGGKTGQEETALIPSFTETSGRTVSLEAGEWNFTLNAYKQDALYLRGRIEGKVIATADDTLDFIFLPQDSGQGTIRITIAFPANARITSATAITDGDTAHPESLTIEGNTAVYSKPAVEAGDYFVSIRLMNSAETLAAVVSEVVVVKGNTASEKIITLTAADLKPSSPAASPAAGFYKGAIDESHKIGSQNLAQALTYITTNAVESDEYYIVLGVSASLSPTLLSYSGKTVGITIMGSVAERQITLSATGSLFTVGQGVTLTLDNNIALQGTSNTSPLVTVSGGTLVMNDGSTVRSNRNSSSTNRGGGISIDNNGLFTMNGGEIIGNTTSSTGGGVYSLGTFTMNGGEITSNTTSSTGGGVYSLGTFTMSGGEVSGNTASAAGGGVYSLGTFTMSGGEISGNIISSTTTSYGGGVYSSGTFTMNGGEISGNTASSSYSSSSSSYYCGGGGVYVSGSGIFIMNSGEISGNTASSSSSFSSYSCGGGVYVYGTFIMSDGEISGNTAPYGGGVYSSGIFTKFSTGGVIYGSDASPASLKNTVSSSSYGHAVYVLSGKKRNTTVTANEVLNSSNSIGWE